MYGLLSVERGVGVHQTPCVVNVYM